MKAKRIYTVHSQHGYCPKCAASLNATSAWADTECDNCGTPIEWDEFISKDELRSYIDQHEIIIEKRDVKPFKVLLPDNLRKYFDL